MTKNTTTKTPLCVKVPWQRLVESVFRSLSLPHQRLLPESSDGSSQTCGAAEHAACAFDVEIKI